MLIPQIHMVVVRYIAESKWIYHQCHYSCWMRFSVMLVCTWLNWSIFGMMWCGVVWRGVVWYGMVWYRSWWYCMFWVWLFGYIRVCRKIGTCIIDYRESSVIRLVIPTQLSLSWKRIMAVNINCTPTVRLHQHASHFLKLNRKKHAFFSIHII